MKFSVFTASTPEWSPQEAATKLAAQGWDGIEWRVTDQAEAAEPGFWAGNRATWPMTGLEDSIPEIARLTADSGLEFSGLGGYARCDNHDDVDRVLAATAALGARQVRVNVLPLGNSNMGGPEPTGLPYPELFAATREHYEWVASRAAHHGVKALVELHHGTVTASASSARRFVGRPGSAACRRYPRPRQSADRRLGITLASTPAPRPLFGTCPCEERPLGPNRLERRFGCGRVGQRMGPSCRGPGECPRLLPGAR